MLTIFLAKNSDASFVFLPIRSLLFISFVTTFLYAIPGSDSMIYKKNTFHAAPQVMHYDDGNIANSPILEEGMTFTIEPDS
jgi:hypothetical protein